jgi:hypothetical protein
MAGYSGTPLPAKLGIKDGHRVAVIGGPDGFDETLGPGAVVQTTLAGKAPLDVILLFVVRRADLEKRLPQVRRRMAENAGFWVAWPKKASRVPTDMTEDVVRAVALPTGLVDNKVCAIDDTWSGLRLVIRVSERKKKSS